MNDQLSQSMTLDAQKPRLTLLVLASTYPRWPDDIEPGFVHELCRRLAKQYEVIALVPDAPGAMNDGMQDGVHVVRFRYAPYKLQTLVHGGGIVTNLSRSAWKWLLVPGFVVGQYLAAKRLIKDRPVDLLHAHWLIPQGLVAYLLTRKFALPYMVTSHGGDLYGLRGQLARFVKQRVAASSSLMTVVSTAMCDEVKRLDLRPPKLSVLPMGADLRRRFKPDDHTERANNEILFVGRLVPKKGLYFLLVALPEVLKERPDVVLTVAGFGPEEDALKFQTRRMGIENNVRFFGAVQQQDLPQLYRRASLLVAPFVRDDSGNQEGLPIVLMEAIGCGCPVIAGYVAGVQDLLGDQAEGVCVNPRDKTALAGSILEALVDSKRAQSQAHRLRSAVVKRFDWDYIAEAYANLIEECAVCGERDSASESI